MEITSVVRLEPLTPLAFYKGLGYKARQLTPSLNLKTISDHYINSLI